MPANAFITNAPSRTLKKRLGELIHHSQELKFLVGFFYFSGWRELYDSLKNRGDLIIKLLVGLDVDKALDHVLEVAKEGDSLSNDELADRFFASMHIALNDEALDNQEFYEQVSYFLELLENGRLQIKKTLEPNHAKLYFFKIKDELKGLLGNENNSKFITGSSNLTRAGIQGQNEFNVEISDYGAKEAEDYFDDLWVTAVPITEIPERREYLTRFVRNRTQVADITPFEAYALVLKSYLDLMEQKTIKPYVVRLLEEHGYIAYQYQMDAVNQALTIIEQYNGVLIADVVGLGKSVIAGMLARNLGRRGMVLCPPGIIGDKNAATGWKKYMHDFHLFDWEVRSSGDLENAAKYLQEHGDDIEVVIVDEAHRFRNEDTEDYEWLSTICRNRIVILLTATPFNNTPQDIFTLLKLFIIPGKSKITLDENLEGRFGRYNADFRRLSYISRYYNSPDPEKRERAEKFYAEMFEAPLPVDIRRVQQQAKKLAAEIRAVLEPVLIRRNRLDLKNDPVYAKEVTQLSKVEDPQELFFGLTPEQMEFYDKVLNEYFSEEGRFHGAIYQPFIYEEHEAIDSDKLGLEENRTYQQQRNLYEFMRRILVKRFESSFGAFAKSIENFERVHMRVLEFIKNSGGKYILDRKLVEKIYESDPDEIEAALEEFARHLSEMKKIPKHQRIYIVKDFDLAEEFMRDIQSDLELMREIRQQVAELDLVSHDPKSACLVTEISEILNTVPARGEPKRKVIIFSEYADTVRHLQPILENAFRGKGISSDSGLSPSLLQQILGNFDASLKPKDQEDDFQILLTTDKLSEGVNLNRAGAIINYDIPWNPTRVIQRLGRINRIGKKVFQSLYLYNFFPTEKGADVIKSREIASQKMFLIHNTIGEDAKIFSIDETPTPSELFKRVNTNPEDEEDESTLTRVRRLFFEIQSAHPEMMERLNQFPARVKTAKAFSSNQLLVFRRKGLGLFIQSIDDTTQEKPEVRSPLFDEALSCIECPESEPRLSLSERFWPAYEAVKEYREVLRVPKSENSLEVKAQNNLQSALQFYKDELEPYLPFIRTLILDLREFKTLPKFTLRRLASVDLNKDDPKSLKNFKSELEFVRIYLGDDYLDIIQKRLGSLKSEVIIAVENCAAISVL
jgi:superfamily II DNA or RNA helicase/HKD family nuclease